MESTSRNYNRKIIHMTLLDKDYKKKDGMFTGLCKIEARNGQMKIKMTFNDLKLNHFYHYNTYLAVDNNGYFIKNIGYITNSSEKNTYVFYVTENKETNFNHVVGIAIHDEDKPIIKGFTDKSLMYKNMPIKEKQIEKEKEESIIDISDNFNNNLVDEVLLASEIDNNSSNHTLTEYNKNDGENETVYANQNSEYKENIAENNNIENCDDEDIYINDSNNMESISINNHSEDVERYHSHQEDLDRIEHINNDSEDVNTIYSEINSLDRNIIYKDKICHHEKMKEKKRNKEEEKNYNLLKQLFKEKEKYNPFGETYPYECINISVIDLILLPIFKNVIKKNPFVINSYINHQHFVIIHNKEENNYMLGIPDYQNPYYKEIGKLYGLNDFMKIPYDDMQFGYWIIKI